MGGLTKYLRDGTKGRKCPHRPYPPPYWESWETREKSASRKGKWPQAGRDSSSLGFQDVSGKLWRLASVHPVVDASVSHPDDHVK